MPGQVDLMLLQNRDAVFEWGTLSWGSSTLAVSASGQILKDVLYLDLVTIEDLTLRRCTLTTSKDYLSGSFNAFDAYGRVWSGTFRGSRSS
jgi:hypothetical protein